MNIHSFLIALTAIGIATQAYASGRDKERISKAPLEDVTVRAKRLDRDAILELGRRKNIESRGLLKEIASSPAIPPANDSEPRLRELQDEANRRKQASAKWAAKQALARMGEEEYFQDFLVGLSTTNLHYKSACVNALGYIGNSRAIKRLGPLLYDNTAPPAEDDVIHPAFSMLAEHALSELLPEVSAQLKKDGRKKQVNFHREWKAWWEKNKDGYSEE